MDAIEPPPQTEPEHEKPSAPPESTTDPPLGGVVPEERAWSEPPAGLRPEDLGSEPATNAPTPRLSLSPTVEVEGGDGEVITDVTDDELLEEVPAQVLDEGTDLELSMGDASQGTPEGEALFPPDEPGTGSPTIEASAPSREQSNVIRMASTLGDLEKARFVFTETASLSFNDVQDLGSVLLHAQWIGDEARMRKVMVRTLIALDQESYRPKLFDLEIHTDFEELASIFLRQLNMSKQKSVRQRLEKSRAKFSAG